MNTQLSIRPMTPEERKYSYTASPQILSQTGCIGHLRVWLEQDSPLFPTSWDDHSPRLNDQDFKEEFDRVVDQLRFDPAFGKMLQNRGTLLSYCYAHEDAAFDPSNSRDYGFRADTKGHSYLLRLNPSKGYHNAYIYCYKKDWLDRHMERAESGIRFIDSHYNDLFLLKDGESIKLTRPDGRTESLPCRYIDPTHVQIGDRLCHICEFAERLEKTGIKVDPLNADSTIIKAISRRKNREQTR